MKALFTFLLVSLLLVASAGPSSAAGPLAIANFSAERGVPFRLLVDGQPATRPAAQQVHLDYLAPGQHWVELSLSAGPMGRNTQRVRANVWLEEGFETNFVLTQRPGYGWQLRQVSTAALPGYGYLDDQDQPASYPGTYPNPPSPAPPVYGQPGGTPPVGAGQPLPGPGYPAGPNYPTAPGGYPATGGYLVLGGRDAADLLQTLKQYPFDDKRLPVFYQALSHAYVRADDLAAMVHTMTYSESQKKAAEYGYSHLVDPQNFHRVLDALTFPTDAPAVLSDLGLPRW